MFRISWTLVNDVGDRQELHKCFSDLEPALRFFLEKRSTFPCRDCCLAFVSDPVEGGDKYERK